MFRQDERWRKGSFRTCNSCSSSSTNWETEEMHRHIDFSQLQPTINTHTNNLLPLILSPLPRVFFFFYALKRRACCNRYYFSPFLRPQRYYYPSLFLSRFILFSLLVCVFGLAQFPLVFFFPLKL